MNIIKKSSIAAGAILFGISTGYVIAQVIEKHREKKLGGKLMRVNYRFTKDYDD